MVNGPLDPRMGTSSKSGFCETCGEALQQCNGHFGLVKLVLPAFHIGYMKMIIATLQNICKARKSIFPEMPQTDQFIPGLCLYTASGEGAEAVPSRFAPAQYR